MGANIREGQIWTSKGAGNRYRVLEVGDPFVTVEALDGGRFGDARYSFHRISFGDGTMTLTGDAAEDFALSTGRVVKHRRHERGHQEAWPTPGDDTMTEAEWQEYAEHCRRRVCRS